MKTLSMVAVILCSIFSFNNSSAQSVNNETIKVWGNCGMCKTKIEKAAKSAGATMANWNEESKELKVSYAVNKTSGDKIQQAVAAVGYDTEDFTAENKVYEKLHGCCQYERKQTEDNMQDKKCCEKNGGKDNCKHDGTEDAHKDKACSKDKSCCSKPGSKTK